MEDTGITEGTDLIKDTMEDMDLTEDTIMEDMDHLVVTTDTTEDTMADINTMADITGTTGDIMDITEDTMVENSVSDISV